jgi:hypothetical protein
MSTARNYGTGVFGVTLGGLNCGLVQSAKFSTMKRPVSDAPMADKLFTQRAMGNPELTDIEIDIALSGGRKEVMNRFKSLFDQNSDNGGASIRFDGAITQCGLDGKAVAIQNFYQGLITKFAFGDFSVDAKAPPTFKITISPEKIENIPGDGSKVQGAVDKTNKEWLASNFRVTIAGQETKNVTKVSGGAATCSVSKQVTGEGLLPELIPGALKFEDLKIDFMSKDRKTWDDWHKEMVFNGNFLAEKDVVVELLDPTMKKTLFTITWVGCGISDLSNAALTNNEAKSSITTASLYAESQTFA